MGIYAEHFQVGTRVYCSLSYMGEGVIFGIEGEQKPASVRNLSGLGVMGGNAHLDIVFASGAVSRKVPESIVRAGLQWAVRDGVADAEEVQDLLRNADRVEADKQAVKAAAAAEFAAERERLDTAPEYAMLKREGKNQGDKRSGVLAAQNIRAQLKKAFPGVVFSVRKRGYGSLRISWEDGPTVSEVEAIAGRYKAGYFDGMQDLYEYQKTPWNSLFGECEYIHLDREISPASIEVAIDRVFEKYSGDLDHANIERPTAEKYLEGTLCWVDVPSLGQSLQQLIRLEAYSFSY